MKSRYLFLTVLTLVSSGLLRSQNTFPSTGNVGINTASPVTKLDVVSSDNIAATTASAVESNNRSSALQFGFNRITQVNSSPASAFLSLGVSNNLNSIYISGSGNIGLGTTTPGSLLEVDSLDNLATSTIAAFGANNRTSALQLGYNRITQVNSNPASAYLSLGVSSSSNALFINGSGNIGVGTTSPVSRFQVSTATNQNVASYSATAASITDFATGGTGWQFSRPEDGAFAHAIYSYNSLGGAKNNLAISSRDDIVFTAGTGGPTSAPERMRISDNGNVGIGTSSPMQKLSVNGTIQAKEVVVETNWADYVFAPGYRLASLSEVATQIKRDGHLPGVPSANDVASHGISVGQTQALLLAKIEELTLHQIALENRLNEQGREMAVLRAECTRYKQRN